jgi:hypothetical protein
LAKELYDDSELADRCEQVARQIKQRVGGASRRPSASCGRALRTLAARRAALTAHNPR